MKYYLCMILICLGITGVVYGQQLNIPLLISGKVYNSDGNPIPENALRFKVYLQNFPESYLTQDSPSCGYNIPVWYAELGNLKVHWDYGDILIIIVEDIERKENVRFSWPIDSTADIPELRTQVIPQQQQISDFFLSDKGVFHNVPVKFTFRSVLTVLPVVELKLFDIQGREIFKSSDPELLDNEQYQFQWNGKSTNGRQLRSGIYYYFFSAAGKILHSGIITLKNE